MDYYVTDEADDPAHLAAGEPVVVDQIDLGLDARLTIPLYGYPLVIVYNLQGSGQLYLTREAYVDIFVGRITRWNHPNLTALNPNMSLPDEQIYMVVGMLLDHFAQAASAFSGENITTDIPSLMANTTFSVDTEVCAKVKATPWSIGFSWMADAIETSSNWAMLQNRDGYWASPISGVPSAMNEYRAAQDATDHFIKPFNMPGRLSWPIIGGLWMTLPEKAASCKELLILQHFVSLVLFQTQSIDQLAMVIGWEPGKSFTALANTISTLSDRFDYREALYAVTCEQAEVIEIVHTVASSPSLRQFALQILAPFTGETDPSFVLSTSDANISTSLSQMDSGITAGLDIDATITWEPVLKSHPELFSIPIFMGGLVPLVNLGTNNTNLVLSVPVLINIFLGYVKTWDDSQIQLLNIGVQLPAVPIVVMAAPIEEEDGATALFASWLAEVSHIPFDWRSVNKTVMHDTDIESIMQYTPYSIGYGIGHFTQDVSTFVPRLIPLSDSNLYPASQQRNDTIAFSNKSLSACWVSRSSPDCWPLALPLAVALRDPVLTGISCEHQQKAVNFVHWIQQRAQGLDDFIVPNLNPNEKMGPAEFCNGRSLLRTIPEPTTLSAGPKITVYVLCAILMVWAVCQAIALAISRKRTELKSASVLFSLLAVVGVFLMLMGPFLIVQDEPTVGGCSAFVWLTSFGYSLCYGSLFAKLSRLYIIFTSRKLIVPRLSNRKLFIIVCVFLALDFLLVLIYNILTPPVPQIYTAYIPDPEDLVTQHREITLKLCSLHAPASSLDFLLIIKGLVALCGAGMAFFIRQVDRRFSATSALGWAFWNLFLTVGIAVIILMVFKDDTDLEAPLFTPVFCGLWILAVTLCALTLDSNVLLACKDLSRPLRRLMNGSKDSKDSTRDSKERKSTSGKSTKEGMGAGETVDQAKRSHSSTTFVVNREMFPSRYEDLDGDLLDKILEELNFQRTAVRRAMALLPTSPSQTTTCIELADIPGRTRDSTRTLGSSPAAKRSGTVAESPRAGQRLSEAPTPKPDTAAGVAAHNSSHNSVEHPDLQPSSVFMISVDAPDSQPPSQHNSQYNSQHNSKLSDVEC